MNILPCIYINLNWTYYHVPVSSFLRLKTFHHAPASSLLGHITMHLYHVTVSSFLRHFIMHMYQRYQDILPCNWIKVTRTYYHAPVSWSSILSSVLSPARNVSLICIKHTTHRSDHIQPNFITQLAANSQTDYNNLSYRQKNYSGPDFMHFQKAAEIVSCLVLCFSPSSMGGNKALC